MTAKRRGNPAPTHTYDPGDPRRTFKHGTVGPCPTCGTPVGKLTATGPLHDVDDQGRYVRHGRALNHHCPKEKPVTVTTPPLDFAQPGDGIKRDRWDRPLIIPATGGERIPYTRASSMSDYIADNSNLVTWSEQHLARGLAMREDLCAMISALPPLGLDDKTDRASKAALNGYMDEAREAAAIHAKANWGTAMHAFTDPNTPSFGPVPVRMRADYASHEEAMRGLKVIRSECFVANDELRAAGTFDKLVEIPGLGSVIGDTKTGSRKPHKEAVQLAVYAGGDFYDGDGDVRTPLPNDINRDWGLIIHVPAGEGRTTLSLVDLAAGRSAALRASWIRDFRAIPDADLTKPLPDVVAESIATARAAVADLVRGASSKDELLGIWSDHKHLWTPDLTALGEATLVALA